MKFVPYDHHLAAELLSLAQQTGKDFKWCRKCYTELTTWRRFPDCIKPRPPSHQTVKRLKQAELL
jgi:uncharacterized protein YecE (DUF72 family)